MSGGVWFERNMSDGDLYFFPSMRISLREGGGVMLIKREYLIINSKGMIINRVEIYWLKRNFLLVLEEGHKKKRREA